MEVYFSRSAKTCIFIWLWSNWECFVKLPFMLYTCSVLVRHIVSKLLEVGDLSKSRLLYSLALAIFLCHKCWWIGQYTSISMIIYLQPDIFFLEPHGISFTKVFLRAGYFLFRYSLKFATLNVNIQPALASFDELLEVENFGAHTKPAESE